MILHIPHSSTLIDGMVELKNEDYNLSYLTDSFADDFFNDNEYESIIFPYSRFVCDVERFVCDPMNEKGQGIIYNKDVLGNDIKRNISDDEVMDLYYDHHDKFNKMVNHYLTLFNKCVIVDCHSFEPIENNDIEFCIGTDNYHTPYELINIVCNHLISKGYKIGINTPFNGTIVPSQHYNTNENVFSIMIEINKTVYVNENFYRVQKEINKIFEKIEKYEDGFE